MGLTAWEVPCLIINLSVSWFGNRKIPGSGAYVFCIGGLVVLPRVSGTPQATPGSRDRSVGTLPQHDRTL